MWILLNPVELFSTDSFLMALRRFMCEREAFLKTIHQGNQLIAASKQLQVCYSDGVLEWAGRKGIEWHLVPMEGQQFRAEQRFSVLKITDPEEF
jgi:hypothetical protein